VQRAPPAAGGDLALGLGRRGERALRQHAQEARQRRVEPLDARERRTRQLDRGHLPARDQVRDGVKRLIVEVGGGHTAP
jgi:hypothetical protein